jgi:F-box domain
VSQDFLQIFTEMELCKLPTELLVNILSYCSGKDVISFSSVCKDLRDIKKDVELIKKLRLVVHCSQTQRGMRSLKDKPNVQIFAEIAEFAGSCRFKSVCLEELECGFVKDEGEMYDEFLLLMETLQGFTEELKIVCSSVYERILQSVVDMFLPTLKKCKLDCCNVYDERRNHGTPYQRPKFTTSTDKHPLKSLEVDEIRGNSVLNIFAGCKQLETFILCDYLDHQLHVFEFLTQQRCLKNLRLDYSVPSNLPIHEKFPGTDSSLWDNMSFQLETFELIGTDIGDLKTATKFFEWQRSLREVSVTFNLEDFDIHDHYFDGEQDESSEEEEDIENSSQTFRQLFATISGLPFLKVFRVKYKDCFLQKPGIVKEITNRTVEVLEMTENSGYDSWDSNRFADKNVIENLMKVFLNVKKVFVKVSCPVLKLSDFPHSKLPCIEFTEKKKLKKFIFKPLTAPEDVEAFQRNVFAFLDHNGEDLRNVEIGNDVEWTQDANFSFHWDLLSAAIIKMPKLQRFDFLHTSLKTLKGENRLGTFEHQPILPPQDQYKFEDEFLRFARENSHLKSLTIGRCWDNFTPSLELIKELIEALPELSQLQIANTCIDFYHDSEEKNRAKSFKYQPSAISGNLEDFERGILELLEVIGGDIQAISIGHENWNRNVSFSLSFNFFMKIIGKTPKLLEVELFNVDDVTPFVSFWVEEGKQPGNMKLKEKTPSEDDTGSTKKFTLEVVYH